MNEYDLLPFHQSLIIIPTYNEKENVKKMLDTLFELYPTISILVIDDHSPDGTTEIIKGLQSQYSQLHLIVRKGKLGLGTAYTLGFKWALERNFQYIFEMDCDFSHDPKEIPHFLQAAQHADLVIGSRYVGGIRIINWPMRRLLLSYLASKYIQIITGINLKDATGGFKCFTRKCLQQLDLNKIESHGYAFQIELNYKVWELQKKIAEIPITFYERQVGLSKMNKKIVVEAITMVLKLRWKKWRGTLIQLPSS